jgi:hypothetical protein
MLIGQAWYLRRELNGLEGRRTGTVTAQVVAASALLGAVAFGVWYGLDAWLGRALVPQIVSVLGGIAVGGGLYALAVSAMRIPEAHQIRQLVTGRLRRA